MTVFSENIELIQKISSPSVTASSGGPVTRARAIYPESMPYANAWSWAWEYAPAPTHSTLLSLWRDTRGGADIFQWTPPGESQIDVRFVPGTLSVQGNPAPNLWAISVVVAALRNHI
ncbi:MAG: hypothetical protein AAF581_11240 [Planctomycetota bacterium]